MKSILVTYETETWNGEAWESGEAATKLDFIDDDTANDLARFVKATASKMDAVAYSRWKDLDKTLRAIESLRRRQYVDGSIKSIQILDTDKE